MSWLTCLWFRSRVPSFVDGALGRASARRVGAHLDRCAACAAEARRLAEVKAAVAAAAPLAPDPDWAPFWPAIRRRIELEAPRPVSRPWWRPIWLPIWGHPRLATGALGAMALMALSFWPAGDAALTAGVVVQDVSTADPDGSVMVYSNPRDDGMTVIWLITAAASGERD
jgi:anti-sigma factor RsiW